MFHAGPFPILLFKNDKEMNTELSFITKAHQFTMNFSNLPTTACLIALQTYCM